MPSPGIDQNLCTGTQICSNQWGNAFGFDAETGKAFVQPGATCTMISEEQGCTPAINDCPEGAIYHVD